MSRKWNVKAGLVLFFAFVFGVGLTAYGEPGLPPLRDDAQRVAYLIWLNQLYPGLLQDAASHETDLLDVLERQQRFEAEHPDYFKNRPKLLSLELKPSAQKAKRTFVTDPAALEAWRKSLLSVATNKGTGPVSEQGLISDLQTTLTSLRGNSSQALLNGLLSTIDPSQYPEGGRTAVFKMKEADRIAYLKAHLPPDLVAKRFRADAFRLSIGATYSPDQALGDLEKVSGLERHASSLISVHTLLQGPDGALLTGSAATEKIEQLSENDFDIFADRAVFKPRLKRIADKLNMGEGDLQKEGIGLIDNSLKKVREQQIETLGRPARTLHLMEVPPHIAVFRGCAGGDCATSQSAVHANGPNERTFLIMNSNGVVKGYLQGTTVTQKLKAGDKLGFHIHTINGKSLTASDLETAVHGLYEGRKELGVGDILLAKESSGNINGSALPTAFNKLKVGKTEVAIEFKDLAEREALQKIQSSSYDNPTKYPNALVYAPGEETTQVEVKKTERELPKFVYTAPTKEQLMLFALDLEFAGAHSNAKRILAMPGLKLSQERFTRLMTLLRNKKKHDLKIYYQMVNERFEAILGAPVDPSVFSDRAYLFGDGHLQAPELKGEGAIETLEPDLLRRTILYLTRFLKEEEDVAPALKIIAKNKKFLAGHEPFQRAVRSLLGDGEEPEKDDLKLLKKILDLGIDSKPYDAEIRALYKFVDHSDSGVQSAVRAVLPFAHGWTADEINGMLEAAGTDDYYKSAFPKDLLKGALSRSPSLQVAALADSAHAKVWTPLLTGLKEVSPELRAEWQARFLAADAPGRAELLKKAPKDLALAEFLGKWLLTAPAAELSAKAKSEYYAEEMSALVRSYIRSEPEMAKAVAKQLIAAIEKIGDPARVKLVLEVINHISDRSHNLAQSLLPQILDPKVERKKRDAMAEWVRGQWYSQKPKSDPAHSALYLAALKSGDEYEKKMALDLLENSAHAGNAELTEQVFDLWARARKEENRGKYAKWLASGGASWNDALRTRAGGYLAPGAPGGTEHQGEVLAMLEASPTEDLALHTRLVDFLFGETTDYHVRDLAKRALKASSLKDPALLDRLMADQKHAAEAMEILMTTPHLLDRHQVAVLDFIEKNQFYDRGNHYSGFNPARRAWLHVGEKAEAKLLSWLTKGKREERERALQWMGDKGKFSKKIVDALVAVAKAPGEDSTRAAAVAGLGNEDPKGNSSPHVGVEIPALAEAIFAGDANKTYQVRQKAMVMLASVSEANPEAHGALVTLWMANGDSSLRTRLIKLINGRGLGDLGWQVLLARIGGPNGDYNSGSAAGLVDELVKGKDAPLATDPHLPALAMAFLENFHSTYESSRNYETAGRFERLVGQVHDNAAFQTNLAAWLTKKRRYEKEVLDFMVPAFLKITEPSEALQIAMVKWLSTQKLEKDPTILARRLIRLGSATPDSAGAVLDKLSHSPSEKVRAVVVKAVRRAELDTEAKKKILFQVLATAGREKDGRVSDALNALTAAGVGEAEVATLIRSVPQMKQVSPRRDVVRWIEDRFPFNTVIPRSAEEAFLTWADAYPAEFLSAYRSNAASQPGTHAKFLELTAHADKEIRRGAFDALSSAVDVQDPRASAVVTAGLKDPETEVADAARRSLMKFGGDTDALVAQLRGAQENDKFFILMGLQKSTDLSVDVLRELAKMMHDEPKLGYYIGAILKNSRTKDPGVMEWLGKVLLQGDAMSMWSALEALKIGLPPARVAELLRQALFSDLKLEHNRSYMADEYVKLSSANHSDVIKVAREHLDSGKPEHRLSAALILSYATEHLAKEPALALKAARTSLTALESHPDDATRSWVLKAVGRFQHLVPEILPELWAAVGAPETLAPEPWAAALEVIGGSSDKAKATVARKELMKAVLAPKAGVHNQDLNMRAHHAGMSLSAHSDWITPDFRAKALAKLNSGDIMETYAIQNMVRFGKWYDPDSVEAVRSLLERVAQQPHFMASTYDWVPQFIKEANPERAGKLKDFFVRVFGAGVAGCGLLLSIMGMH